jgi:hypothetical protein
MLFLWHRRVGGAAAKRAAPVGPGSALQAEDDVLDDMYFGKVRVVLAPYMLSRPVCPSVQSTCPYVSASRTESPIL